MSRLAARGDAPTRRSERRASAAQESSRSDTPEEPWRIEDAAAGMQLSRAQPFPRKAELMMHMMMLDRVGVRNGRSC